MPSMYGQEVLNLKSMEDLNRSVERLIPAVVNSLEDASQKASLTITIDFQLMEDSDRTLKVTHKVKPNYPSKAKALLAHRDLAGNLTADAYDLGVVDVPKQSTLKTLEGKSINDAQEAE